VADDSRADILGRLRAAQPRQSAEHVPIRPRPAASPLESMALFVDRLGAARATVERVASLAEVPAAVARYLAGQNLPAAVTVAPELRDRLDFSHSAVTVEDGLPLEDGRAVVAGCLAGVAETGTFVAGSGPGRDQRLNYLAETLIVVIGAGQVVASYEEVWTGLRVRTGREAPRLVSFITGPSRTADIEQTIEMGAHGPRRLHVLISEQTP
jgi:L-lactate dehydrogenase complex protein LldG